MKSAILGVAILALGGAIATQAAWPGVGPLKAKVPFEFHVGNYRLPAGTYMVRQVSGSVLEVRNMDTRATATMTYFPDQKNSTNGKGGFAFRCYGEKCFFAGAWTSSGSAMSLVRTKTERETATNIASVPQASRKVAAD
jgi:hypothetical protein